MPVTRLNEFPEGSGSLTNDDVFIFMDNPATSGVTKKVSLNALKTIIGASGGGSLIDEPPSDNNTYGRRNGAWVDLASATALQFRQGTNADRLAMNPVPAMGEPIYTTDSKRFFIGDGTTVGGNGLFGNSDSYVICQPGDDIISKYNEAKLLTPNGQPLGTANRAALLVLPGVYTVDSTTYVIGSGNLWANKDPSQSNLDVGLYIDTNFVDIIGIGSSPNSPSFRVNNTNSKTTYVFAENVVIVGMNTTYQFGPGGQTTNDGPTRFIINYGGSWSPQGFASYTSGVPHVIGGYFNGGISELWGGNRAGGEFHVFNGTVVNHLAPRRHPSTFMQGVLFQGIAMNCNFRNSLSSSPQAGRSFQGHIIYCRYDQTSSTLPPRSADGLTVPAAFTGTCTISSSSPAVITKNSHGLFPGVRVNFSTDGTLPAGLAASTNYFVKNVTTNTFEVSTSINGTSINTSSSGSGNHSIVIPSGISGGRYSFCVTSNGEFTSP